MSGRSRPGVSPAAPVVGRPGEPPVVLRHAGCGEPVAAELRCRAGHPATPGELELAAAADLP